MSPMAKTSLPASTGQSSTPEKQSIAIVSRSPKTLLRLQSLGAGTHQDNFILSWIAFSFILPRWAVSKIIYLQSEYYLI